MVKRKRSFAGCLFDHVCARLGSEGPGSCSMPLNSSRHDRASPAAPITRDLRGVAYAITRRSACRTAGPCADIKSSRLVRRTAVRATPRWPVGTAVCLYIAALEVNVLNCRVEVRRAPSAGGEPSQMGREPAGAVDGHMRRRRHSLRLMRLRTPARRRSRSVVGTPVADARRAADLGGEATLGRSRPALRTERAIRATASIPAWRRLCCCPRGPPTSARGRPGRKS